MTILRESPNKDNPEIEKAVQGNTQPETILKYGRQSKENLKKSQSKADI
jgi:hypothetical protein